MRHALVPFHLIQDARASGAPLAERAAVDAPAEAPPTTERRPRRLASLLARARVRALGLGAESPGGGA